MASRPHRAPLQMTRRALLAAATGTAGISALGASAATASTATATASASAATVGPLPTVSPLPAGAPVRTAFAPQDQLYARFLAVVAGMANDIDDSDTADRGFMAGRWWRANDNRPTNARVQEHVATLSWFYANDRPWNPYHLDSALFGRLEAAIEHYLNLQNSDGSFPEYWAGQHSLAATAFGLGYLAKTYKNLKEDAGEPAVRVKVLTDRLATSLNQAMDWFLDPGNTGTWGNGGPTAWANQVVAGLAGTTRALQLLPNASRQAALANRMAYFAAHAQSPAGYYYESGGMDVAYNFEVQMPEMAEIYVRTGSAHMVTMASRWADWFGYLALREPGDYGFVTYTAASCRTEIRYYDSIIDEPDETYFGAHLVKAVPKLAACYITQEDRDADRRAWRDAPGPAPAIPKGDRTQPREPALLPLGQYLPARAQRDAAIQQLPYMAATNWAEIRRDNAGQQQDYVFVRRSRFYFGAFFGQRPQGTVSSGAGFLWHPLAGILIHSGQDQTLSWGTLAGSTADTKTSLRASYQINGAAWDGGRRNGLGSGTVTVRHSRGDGSIATKLSIGPDSVTRAVSAGGAATEQIPLVLRPSDSVTFGNGTTAPHNATTSATTTSLTIRRGVVTITIAWDRTLTATLSGTSRTFFRNGLRRTHMLRIPYSGSLTTRITVGG